MKRIHSFIQNSFSLQENKISTYEMTSSIMVLDRKKRGRLTQLEDRFAEKRGFRLAHAASGGAPDTCLALEVIPYEL